VLLLGGSTEASALARALAGDGRFDVTLSLAGATRHPRPQPVPVRTGGFGGVDGLRRFLAEQRIGALVDATHPFAAQMTRHAAEAAGRVPLLRLERPAWVAEAGDHWLDVPDMPAAARALGETPRRVLLTVGQKELAPFRDGVAHHYVVRSIDPPDAASLPPGAVVLTDAGPFHPDAERALLLAQGIEVIVTKNSGGSATFAKLLAARALGIPVVMVRRPAPVAVERAATVEAAVEWLVRCGERGQGGAAPLDPPLG